MIDAIEIGCTGINSGYGQVAHGLREAFAKLGIEDRRSGLVLLVNPTFAFHGAWEGQEVWDLTMWETTRIPELVVEKIDNFEGIIVPNDYNLEQFSEWHENVSLAPMGVNPDVWNPSRRKVDGEFRFLVSGPKPGGNDLRKGFDVAKAAFELAFPEPQRMDPTPTLTQLHSFGKVSEAEFVDRFHDHHAYIGLSRGEGWHLLPFQMLATGAPVVASDIPGHAGWSWLPGVYKVPCGLSPSPIGGIGSSWSGNWWEPNVQQAAVALRRVYDDYALAHTHALEGGEYISRYMTWDDSARRVLEIVGTHERPMPGDRWLEAKARTFPVTCLRNETVDIGEARLRLRKDEVVRVSADQMRVLLGAGMAAA